MQTAVDWNCFKLINCKANMNFKKIPKLLCY